MWELKQLQESHQSQTEINGEWVSARPLNYTKKYCPFWKRLIFACEVLKGTAETFRWPGNQ